MPLYEYRCDACGRTFEELRSSSEADAAIECPSCESRKTARKLSTFASGPGASGSAKGGSSCGTRFT
jgi:putative FmdB family regulatory protein